MSVALLEYKWKKKQEKYHKHRISVETCNNRKKERKLVEITKNRTAD